MKNKIVFYATPYKGYYVSKDGDIYSEFTKKCLSPKIDKDGYLEYGLSVNGAIAYFRGHRIVAETFLENPDNKPTVNHKNGNKSDNSVDNLEWATHSENNYHRYNILHCVAPNKWNIDVYCHGSLYGENFSLSDCVNAGISSTYLRAVHDKNINRFFMFFEKMEDSSVRAYWNGEIVFRFDSAKIAAKSLGVKLHSLYHRMKYHKDVEYITRDYRFVFKSSKKV